MEIVTAWTELGSWHTGPAAPNGSVPGCQERRAVRIEVYRADFYGRGPHTYMRGTPLFQSEYDYAPRAVWGGFDDGNTAAIAARAAKVGARIPA